MPITLKKDEWKVKDPSSGNYRGAAILSTTLPEDAAQIIEDTQNALDAEEVRAGQIINDAQNAVDGIEGQSSLIQQKVANAVLNGNNYELIDTAVESWLDAHPEATTTVENHSLTYEKLVNGTLGYVTPEMFGAVGDGIADDSYAINDAIRSGKPVYFGNKTYFITNSIVVLSGTNLIGNHTTIHAPASDSNNLFTAFSIINCDYVLIDGFKIYSERTKQENPPPGEFIHQNPLGSNVHGFGLTNSNFITIKNTFFNNLKADFWIQNNANLTECSNIIIDGWYSRNTTMPMYANRINNLLIENADILPAKEMCNGDHILYISSYCHDWIIRNCVFKNPDEYYGPTVTGHTASNDDKPYNIILENCNIYSLYSPSLSLDQDVTYILKNCECHKDYYSSSSNTIFTGPGKYLVYNCILDGTNSAAQIVYNSSIEMYGGICKCGMGFTIGDNSSIKIDSVKFYLNEMLAQAVKDITATIELTNCIFIGSSGNYFFRIYTNNLTVTIINCSFLKNDTNNCIIFMNEEDFLTASNYIIMNVSARTTKNDNGKLFYYDPHDALTSGVFIANTLYT